MAEAGTAQANIVAKVYSGDEADTIVAQAKGYKRIVWEILNGNADTDPAAFVSTCKRISGQQAQVGA